MLLFLRTILILCPVWVLVLSGCSSDDSADIPEEIREAIQAIEEEETPPEPKETGPLFPDELVRLLLRELKDDDEGAFAVAVRYGEGNRDLEFAEAEFIARKRSAQREKKEKDGVRVLFRNGLMAVRETVSTGDAPEALGDIIRPMRAIRAARSAGLDAWWDVHPKAQLAAELLLRDDLDALNLSGRGTWVWRIALESPGEPRSSVVYIEAGTLRFLRAAMEKASAEEAK